MNPIKTAIFAALAAAVTMTPQLFADEVKSSPAVEKQPTAEKAPANEGAKVVKERKVRNRNLSIVIDRSASLGARVFEKSKERAIETVNSLTANDFISLVAFGEQVEVLASSRLATDEVKKDVVEKIKTIKLDNKAAMFAGLAKGADELRKNLDKKYENKIEVFSSHDRKNAVGPSTDDELTRLIDSFGKEKIKVAGVARNGNPRGVRRATGGQGKAKGKRRYNNE
jgi:Ca-activated chloride channel family protein